MEYTNVNVLATLGPNRCKAFESLQCQIGLEGFARLLVRNNMNVCIYMTYFQMLDTSIED